ncbi:MULTISPECIES: methylated-DNA--[protein]-cysteine S-methyltransferase [Jonquetella]|uniref:methylated-DNA--[protein]-cysteine S-methyltransferase n=1 Tax=Jonquetella TaxID=428711 RepID=UPI0003ADDA7B|nr:MULTISPECIES: methylated-DNA--[protein]-cysteine S-methyltransferase [Jonquetella]ERL23417.1 DNA-binding domain, methylated-DNA-[protein]-cysteine S-methyltransferase family protein [Jonquetella sp. BV3C21]
MSGPVLLRRVDAGPFPLLVGEENGKLVKVGFPGELGNVVQGPDTPLLRETARQLRAYFSRRLKVFDLPLAFSGTPFQLQVWEALRLVPWGKTVTYSELARRTARPKAARAVGNAMAANPLVIVIPCHRVVLSDGRLGQFGGGAAMKQFLLANEGVLFQLPRSGGGSRRVLQ